MFVAKQEFSDRIENSTRPIKVMLVDDSIVARSIFERILSQSKQIEIVCQAENPEIAIRLLQQHRVDLILLDIEMPRRSGLEALPDLLEQSDGARIMVVSSFAEENGPAAIQALSRGACDTLAKPGRSGFNGRFSQLLLDKVERLGATQRLFSNAAVPLVTHDPVCPVLADIPECIAIGASTGGIPAIYDLVKSLDPAIDCPILITQHLPVAFMSFFARQLADQTHREVSVARPGEIVQRNHIYIASGDSHLVCRKKDAEIFIDHLHDYAGSRYCPSVDAMFESVADVFGERALAVILSGMGNDGTEGARALAEQNANIIVQDAESSVVWGMPGSVFKAHLATAILPASQIGKLISKSAGRAR